MARKTHTRHPRRARRSRKAPLRNRPRLRAPLPAGPSRPTRLPPPPGYCTRYWPLPSYPNPAVFRIAGPKSGTTRQRSSAARIGSNARHGKTMLAQERLLAQPVLGGVQNFAGRPHQRALRGRFRRRRGHVLELERDHIHGRGKLRARDPDPRTARRFQRPQSGRWANRDPANTYEPDTPCGAPKSRTCGPAARCRAHRWSNPGRTVFTSSGSSSTFRFCCSRNALSFSRSGRRLFGQDRYRQQRRVLRSRRPDRQRRYGNTRGHLHNREQRIEPLQRLAFDRNAEHGQRGVRRRHAGQMRRPARARDDHFDAPAFRAGRKLRHQFRRAMSGHHAAFVRHPELGEHLARRAHRLPIRLAAHDDGHQAGVRGQWPCASVNPCWPSYGFLTDNAYQA